MNVKDRPISAWFTRPLVSALLVVILSLLVYLPSMNGAFIFDDVNNIIENPIIKDFGYFADLDTAKGFDEHQEVLRRYVGYLSFAVNYSLGGLDTTGYHIMNVIIHIANALLVYILVLLTFKTPFLVNSRLAGRAAYLALLAAAIFALHPIQTQAVSYIVQRLASLATMFYLASIVCYLSFRLSEGRKTQVVFYVLSLVCAVLGMKTKEITFTLPLAILLYELFFFKGSLKKRLALWVPMGLTLFIIPLSVLNVESLMTDTVQELGESVRARGVGTASREQFILTEFRVLVTYLRLLIFPFNQNLDYDYALYKTFLDPHVWPSFILLCGFFCIGVATLMRSRRGDPGLRVISLGVFWFFLTLLVESTLVPLFVIFEHRMYLPMAGVAIGSATVALLLVDSLREPRMRRAVVSLAVAVPLLFACASFIRNFTWRTNISMWEDTVRKSPEKSRVHVSLGDAYRAAGRAEEAEAQYNASLSAKTFEDFSVRILTFINMGNIYFDQGDNERAIKYYKSSIELNPEYELGYYNLAIAYLSEGRIKESLAALRTTLEKNPGFANAYYMMGEAYMKQGTPSDAILSYQKAIQLDPGLGKAYLGLATALETSGRTEEALEHYRIATSKLAGSPEAHYRSGNALREAGDMDGARAAWERAVELDPEHAGALGQLGAFHMMQGNAMQAVQYFQRSLTYNEANPETHYNIAIALKSLGRTNEAVEHYQRFIELAPPEYAEVVRQVKAKLQTME